MAGRTCGSFGDDVGRILEGSGEGRRPRHDKGATRTGSFVCSRGKTEEREEGGGCGAGVVP